MFSEMASWYQPPPNLTPMDPMPNSKDEANEVEMMVDEEIVGIKGRLLPLCIRSNVNTLLRLGFVYQEIPNIVMEDDEQIIVSLRERERERERENEEGIRSFQLKLHRVSLGLFFLHSVYVVCCSQP